MSPIGDTQINPFFSCFNTNESNFILCPTFKIDSSSNINFNLDIAKLNSICLGNFDFSSKDNKSSLFKFNPCLIGI